MPGPFRPAHADRTHDGGSGRLIIAITEEILKVTEFEVFAFWEDMAYRGGPLIGPAMFRKLALPHYRRVCDWLRSRGVKHIGRTAMGTSTP